MSEAREGKSSEHEDFMPGGTEVREASGEITIVLALREANVLLAARKMSMLLAERLARYRQYPDFSGRIFFSIDSELIAPTDEHRVALERLIGSRQKEVDAQRTVSGKPIRLEVAIGTDALPRGELVRMGVREELAATPVTSEATSDKQSVVTERRNEKGEFAAVVELDATSASLAGVQLQVFLLRHLDAYASRPDFSGEFVFCLDPVRVEPNAENRRSFHKLVAGFDAGLSKSRRAASGNPVHVLGSFGVWPGPAPADLLPAPSRPIPVAVPGQRRPLLGLLLLLVLAVGLGAVMLFADKSSCREPKYRALPGLPRCALIQRSAQCSDTPGCAAAAECVQYDQTIGHVPCAALTTRGSCSANVACYWISCTGEPRRECGDHWGWECPSPICESLR